MSTEVVICPLCRGEIHRHVAGKVETKISLPSRTRSGGNALAMLMETARREQEKEMMLCEQACVSHYQAHHRLRFSVWRRVGWKWLLRWPTKKPHELPGQQIFDPVQFIK